MEDRPVRETGMGNEKEGERRRESTVDTGSKMVECSSGVCRLKKNSTLLV